MPLTLYAHPFSVLLPEGADRALRERDAVRIPRCCRTRTREPMRNSPRCGRSGAFRCCVDDARTVVEASIIIEHLGLRHPGPVRLLPADPRAALEVRMHRPLLRQLRRRRRMQKIVARQHCAPRASAMRAASPRRARCSTPPTAGSTSAWPGANGRPATPSALADCAAAPALVLRRLDAPHRRRASRMCSPTGAACWRGRRSPAPSTKRVLSVRFSRSARRIATERLDHSKEAHHAEQFDSRTRRGTRPAQRRDFSQ